MSEIIDYQQKYAEPLPENKVDGVDYAEMYRKTKLKERFTPEEFLAYKYAKKREEYYKKIDISHVCKNMDGKWRAKDKWRLESGNLVYQKNQTWLFVSGANSDIKGRFGPYLVQTELDLNIFQMVDWYTEKFGYEYDEELTVSDEFMMDVSHGSGHNQNVFSPPPRNDENWNDVFKYLNEKRNIPPYVLNKLYEEGKVYADSQSRCIFLSTASAEIRATPASPNPGFKGCVQGGQADVSGFSVMPEFNANESSIVIIEAAVDAISYNVMFPGSYAFSSNGSGRFELHYKIAIEAMANGFNLKIGTDADEAGDVAAQKVFSALLTRQYLYAKYKEAGLKYKDIDEAIIDGRIKILVDESPHQLFFNEQELKDEYPIFEKQEVFDEEIQKNKLKWVDTGKVGKKEFAFKIQEGDIDLIPNGEERKVKLNSQQVEMLKHSYKIQRVRPPNEKDWNAELILLGSEYLNKYKEAVENNFETLPKLPDELEKFKSEIKPIVFDKNGNPIIVKKEDLAQKVESKPVEAPKVENENSTPAQEQDDGVFKGNYSRQALFNTLYLRYYLKQKEKMDFSVVDDKFKNNEIKIMINRDQPYLNFIDQQWQDKFEYKPKEPIEGDKVYYPPTIRYIHNGKNEKLIVNQKAFMSIVKIMDDLAISLMNEEDQKSVLNKNNFNCFNESKTGLPLTVLLGKGNLLKKHTVEERSSPKMKM